jgi:hypothetical protein
MVAGGSSLTEWSVPHPWPASRPARLMCCPSRERPVLPGCSPGLTGAKGIAESGDRLRQGDCCLAGDVPSGLVLGAGVDELGVLVLDVLRILAGRGEQQRLQVAEQVLAGLPGHLPVSDAGLQAADQDGSRRGDRRQRSGRGLPCRRPAWRGRLVLQLLSRSGAAVRRLSPRQRDSSLSRPAQDRRHARQRSRTRCRPGHGSSIPGNITASATWRRAFRSQAQ